MAADPPNPAQGQQEALRLIIREALAARSALCEHELVIRLDAILALARDALAQASPTQGHVGKSGDGGGGVTGSRLDADG
ncbi:hypothetical protein [Azospirillum picis]|uniref:Uncharacterized protein n=1 Tax=Azospirillum picis TaxID=488438 RepID=A0ABU0MT77_9PROT|nr:hypothetical protein [Azospirillum picis]MBP2302944.1 hypothetical protein [Azospirillum picis]MDQ0536696.1 hypothetical protein [Azospirillum picis]